MDDYEWRKMLKRRNRRSRLAFLALFLIAACLLSTGIWYFCFYTRSPEYALRQTLRAVETHDRESFQRFVNLETVTNHAYDDLTYDLFVYDSTLTPKTKVLFEKFYVSIKPQLAGGTAETILRRVESGQWSLPDGTDILKGRQLGIDYERFLERSQLRNTTFVKLGEVARNGTNATATLEIREDYTQTPFTLEVAMEQAGDGHWQITYVKNYRDYLDTVAGLQNGDIADYIAATEPVVDAYNQTFRAQQARFKALSASRNGRLGELQRTALADLLEQQVIPTLEERQQKLDAIDVPAGAGYLARQRQHATEITIKAWRHYINGLRKDDPEEFDTAETLHKQELEVDLRVEDIIHHTAVSKNMPNLP